jgi:hypothetical protein
MTPVTAPGGDVQLEARWNNQVKASTPIKVVIPKQWHPEPGPGPRTIVNSAEIVQTSGGPRGRYRTKAIEIVTLTVEDQFQGTLDAIYNVPASSSVAVFERFTNVTNSTSAAGHAIDPAKVNTWIEIELPDKAFTAGKKSDECGFINSVVHSNPSESTVDDWVKFLYKPEDFNQALAVLGNPMILAADMELRVHGHVLTDKYRRTWYAPAQDYVNSVVPFGVGHVKQ